MKNNGWRHDPKSAGATRKRRGGATSGQGARDRGRTQQQQRVESAKVPVQAKHPPQQQTTTATLLVPFSVGSALQREVQEVEDDFVAMTGCQRGRVVEQGGDKLVNLLGRQDPWASKRVCPDPECPACLSRTWLRQQKSAAKKSGVELPGGPGDQNKQHVQKRRSPLCPALLDLCPGDQGSFYQGEMSCSARQCQKQNVRDLQGVLPAPPWCSMPYRSMVARDQRYSMWSGPSNHDHCMEL